MNQIFVNQSKAAQLVGCSRNNFSKMWKKEQETPGTHSFFTVDGKIDITDFEFVEKYGDHTGPFLAENKKTEKKQASTPAKKRGRPQGSKSKNKAIPEPSAPAEKPKTKKQIEQEQKKLETEAAAILASKNPALKKLQEQSTIAKYEKIILDKEKAKIEVQKSRAELCSVDTLVQTCIGYLIALNKELFDQPRSYVDEFEAAMKTGKSKTELTDILRIPATNAVNSTIDIIYKKLEKYKRSVRRATKKMESEE